MNKLISFSLCDLQACVSYRYKRTLVRGKFGQMPFAETSQDPRQVLRALVTLFDDGNSNCDNLNGLVVYKSITVRISSIADYQFLLVSYIAQMLPFICYLLCSSECVA